MKKLTLDTKIMVICQSACGSAGITANGCGFMKFAYDKCSKLAENLIGKFHKCVVIGSGDY